MTSGSKFIPGNSENDRGNVINWTALLGERRVN